MTTTEAPTKQPSARPKRFTHHEIAGFVFHLLLDAPEQRLPVETIRDRTRERGYGDRQVRGAIAALNISRELDERGVPHYVLTLDEALAAVPPPRVTPRLTIRDVQRVIDAVTAQLGGGGVAVVGLSDGERRRRAEARRAEVTKELRDRLTALGVPVPASLANVTAAVINGERFIASQDRWPTLIQGPVDTTAAMMQAAEEAAVAAEATAATMRDRVTAARKAAS